MLTVFSGFSYSSRSPSPSPAPPPPPPPPPTIFPPSRFDLYSKADSVPKVEELRPYYQRLIDEYIPGVINF